MILKFPKFKLFGNFCFLEVSGVMKRKIFSILWMVISLFCMVACGGKGKVVCEITSQTETRVVITVSEATENATVIKYALCSKYSAS